MVTGVPEAEGDGVYSPYSLTENGIECADSNVCAGP